MNSNISVTFTDDEGGGVIIYDQRSEVSGGDTERLKELALAVGGGSCSLDPVDVYNRTGCFPLKAVHTNQRRDEGEARLHFDWTSVGLCDCF